MSRKNARITKGIINKTLWDLEEEYPSSAGVTFYRLTKTVAAELDIILTTTIEKDIRSILKLLIEKGGVMFGGTLSNENKNRYKTCKKKATTKKARKYLSKKETTTTTTTTFTTKTNQTSTRKNKPRKYLSKKKTQTPEPQPIQKPHKIKRKKMETDDIFAVLLDLNYDIMEYKTNRGRLQNVNIRYKLYTKGAACFRNLGYMQYCYQEPLPKEIMKAIRDAFP